MVKVLLVSPTDPKIPKNLKFLMGGENTYTQTLLANPPKGVEYIHHLEALSRGLVEYLPIQRILANLVKFRVLPTSSGTQAIFLKSKFDLIHCHTYSLKVEGFKVPVVVSDSSSNYLFLRDYLNWPKWRIKGGLTLKRELFKRLNVIDADTNLEGAKKLVVFSKFAAMVHQNLAAQLEKIEVIYPGLPKSKVGLQKKGGGVNILFIGVWFERKGGSLLLEAFKILSRKFPDLRLTIIGPIPKGVEIKNLPILQKDFVPREELLKEFFPKADIFVLVPLKAEGFGFVLLEAASFGVPAVVTNVYALPEIVEDGKSGFVVEPANLESLVEKLEILITNEKLRQKFGRQALMKFSNQFSIEKSNQKLLEVYLRALRENIRGAPLRGF